jgi:hypothetical protein
MESKRNKWENTKCPVCQEGILPHEVALFYSGKGNLVQMRVAERVILVHEECADSFDTRSQLLQFLTDGKHNLNWLE